MSRTIKLCLFIGVLALTFALQGCWSFGETEERTPEIEASEIKTTITKLQEKGYDIDTTALGVYYITHELGTGPLPETNDTLYIEYSGYFLNGVLFDASIDHYSNGIWVMKFRNEQLIPGFEDGLALMPKGSKIDIIVPSILAYGARGNLMIPPYTPLLFSLKMHDLKPAN